VKKVQTSTISGGPISIRRRQLEAADAKMRAAKDAFSHAALACLRGRADAVAKTRAALDQVEEARQEIARLSDQTGGIGRPLKEAAA
jgi:hypothetical protein